MVFFGQGQECKFTNKRDSILKMAQGGHLQIYEEIWQNLPYIVHAKPYVHVSSNTSMTITKYNTQLIQHINTPEPTHIHTCNTNDLQASVRAPLFRAMHIVVNTIPHIVVEGGNPSIVHELQV